MEQHISYFEYFVKFAIFSGLVGLSSCWITCRSPSNDTVDWFIVYKVPAIKKSLHKGSEFFYMDENSPNFSESEGNIHRPSNNPIYETLFPLYTESNQVEKYGMYNDQPPNEGPKSNHGHSKGFFAFDKDSGFWIISSVPNFPAPVPKAKTKKADTAYKFQDGQTTWGQILFCVTLKSTAMKILDEAFAVTNPNLYDFKNVKLRSAKNTKKYMKSFETNGNGKLKLIAKSSSFGKDLYKDLITDALKDSIYVQSWKHNLQSDEKVTDVTDVYFEKRLTFSTTTDHSKWAVTKKESWTCISDINRHVAQYSRGGLALCLYNTDVAKQFRKLVEQKKRNKPKNQQKPTQSEERNLIEKIYEFVVWGLGFWFENTA